jgi:hypothetical protein
MSKRVIIILVVGLLAIVAAFFVHKYEVEPIEEEATPKPKPKKAAAAATTPATEEPQTPIISAATDEQN